MKRIYIILLLILACRPAVLLAENETSYLPSIGIRQGGVVKQGRTVELTMSVDLSKAKIRTQHTVALTPVLVSADGNREIAFPPIVIDGKTRLPCPTSGGCSTGGSSSARRYTAAPTAARVRQSKACGVAYCPPLSPITVSIP